QTRPVGEWGGRPAAPRRYTFQSASRLSRREPLMSRCALLVWMLSVTAGVAADWPQFRGPTGDGHYTGPKLPTEWGPDTNVAWKAAIPGKGWSSPVVAKGKVYLTTAVQSGGGLSLRVVCVDAESGKVDWAVEELKTQKSPNAN